MKKETLTAMQVKHLKPTDRRQEIPAGPPLGLYLLVGVSGAKSWVFRYRWKGKPKKLTFAKAYPEMKLGAARAEADRALEDLKKNGIDPAVEKAAEQAQPDTMQAVVDEFIVRKVAGTKTQSEVERIFRKEIVPAWKHRNIDEIRRADVLRLVDAISDRGAPVMANKTLSVMKRLFNWSVGRGLIEVSPAGPVEAPNKERSRERVLSDAELVDIWNAVEKLGYPLAPFYRFLILSVQRRGEVANLEWQDVNLDTGLWTLPPEKTKPGRVHDVPLSTAALELLENLPRFEGPYLFSTTGGKQPINGFSKAKTRLDEEIAKLRRKREEEGETDDWRVHDLRRTAATWMAGSGVPSEVLSRILNHSPGSTQGVTHIYNRFRYVEERREALEAWAEHLSNLVEAIQTKAASA